MKSLKTLCIAALAACFITYSPMGAMAGDRLSPLGAGSIDSSESTSERISGMKSERTAMLLSLLSTVIPVAAGLPSAFHEENDSDASHAAAYAFIGGALLGPSVGHFYAYHPWRALAGIGLRTVGLGVFLAGLALGWDEPDNSAASALALGGIVLAVGSAALDISRAGNSARSYNEKLRQEPLTISIAPSRGPVGLGISVNLSF